MEVTQLLRVGLGLVVGLSPQYSHPVCMTTELKHSQNNQLIAGHLPECPELEFNIDIMTESVAQ